MYKIKITQTTGHGQNVYEEGKIYEVDEVTAKNLAGFSEVIATKPLKIEKK